MRDQMRRGHARCCGEHRNRERGLRGWIWRGRRSRAFRAAGDEFDARARAGRCSRACKASRLFFSRVLACAGSAKATASSDGQCGVAVVLSLAVAASCVADLRAGGGRCGVDRACRSGFGDCFG